MDGRLAENLIQHKLELFDKLLLPIMNYCSNVWRFNASNAI